MALYKNIADVPATPFYYYDMELFGRTLLDCKVEAELHGYTVHYAVKANAEPRILQTVARSGFGADCVSGWEVEAALNNGFAPKDIVFAGVGKSDDEIRLAIEAGIFCFNCESLQEIEVINEIARSMRRRATIALRINPSIDPDTHRYISTGQSASKFGISYDEVRQAISSLAELSNIKISGLHFHIGSGIVNIRNFVDLALRVNQINDWFSKQGVDIEHLNLGGGLGINYLDPDSELIADFKTYFNAFADNLRPHTGQRVHFELGRSLVGQCGELITRVLYAKKTASDEQFLIVDAGMTDLIRPALYSAQHRIENLSAQWERRSYRPERYYIGGPICESSDIFAHDIEFPLSGRGDLLAIRSVGAYGSVMSSTYNLRPLARSYYSQ